MNTKPFPLLCDPVSVFAPGGGDVGISSRTEHEPTASLMPSLCAEGSGRRSLCSGPFPRYYIRFPRQRALIVGLLSVTEPEISSFSRGDSFSNGDDGKFISLFYPKQKQKCIQLGGWLLLARYAYSPGSRAHG